MIGTRSKSNATGKLLSIKECRNLLCSADVRGGAFNTEAVFFSRRQVRTTNRFHEGSSKRYDVDSYEYLHVQAVIPAAD